MFQMAEETNWHKHVAIGTYILVVLTLGIGVLAYIRPPDPNHPIGFDFLSKEISLPLWLVAIAILGLVSITAAVVRMTRRETGGSSANEDRRRRDMERLKQELAKANSQIETLQQQLGKAAKENGSLSEQLSAFRGLQSSREHDVPNLPPKQMPVAKLPATIPASPHSLVPEESPYTTTLNTPQIPQHFQQFHNIGEGGLTYESSSNYSIQISRYESNEARGLLIRLHNDGLSRIATHRIIVRTAQSYNAALRGYRDNSFAAFSYQNQQVVAGSDSASPIPLVRKEPTQPDLLVGNDSGHPLQWPPKDTAQEHFWLLAIHVDAFSAPKTGSPNPTPLDQLEMQVVVSWKKETNEFSVTPRDSPAK
jgi:TolA-binding protein